MPLYVAVIEWTPTDNVLMGNVTVPVTPWMDMIWRLAMMDWLSAKDTTPVGGPFAVTVAVKFTVWPKLLVGALEVSVVVVPASSVRSSRRSR
jgi:hypothetical protein